MSVGESIKNKLASVLYTRSSLRTAKTVSQQMQVGCKNLQTAFDARAAFVDAVLHDLGSENETARQLHLYDARTLTAAQDVLEMPVLGAADLFIKYNTVALYEDFYLERPNLLKSLLRHMRDDAQSMVSVATQEASQALRVSALKPQPLSNITEATHAVLVTRFDGPAHPKLLRLPALNALSRPGDGAVKQRKPARAVQAAAPAASPPAVEPPSRPAESTELPPALGHLAAAGSQIIEIGSSHGMRSVVARNGKQFMFFHAVPDGSAIVGGLISEMTPAQLLAAAGSQAKELGTSHGLRGIFVDVGAQFQVFYVTPDGERVIAGGMWDAAGHNVTADQVKPFQGTIATVEIGPGAQGTPIDGEAAAPGAALATPSAVAVSDKTAAGTLGDAAAPKLYMFIDPLCSFSVRAMQQLKPLVDAKRLQVAVIPIPILDHEDAGRSTTSTLAMLSLPAEQMVPAWAAGRLDGPPSPDAQAKLIVNRAAAEQLRLRGTPTLIWRKADGSEGRADGLPSDLNALVASIAR